MPSEAARAAATDTPSIGTQRLRMHLATGCTDWSDCGYLGQCSHGVCACEAPWIGPECQQLDLAPTPDASGYQQANTSSWGGSVVRDDHNRLYMYAAEMVGECGIQLGPAP